MIILDGLADSQYRLALKRMVQVGFGQLDYVLYVSFRQFAESFFQRRGKLSLNFVLDGVEDYVCEQVPPLAPAASHKPAREVCVINPLA